MCSGFSILYKPLSDVLMFAASNTTYNHHVLEQRHKWHCNTKLCMHVWLQTHLHEASDIHMRLQTHAQEASDACIQGFRRMHEKLVMHAQAASNTCTPGFRSMHNSFRRMHTRLQTHAWGFRCMNKKPQMYALEACHACTRSIRRMHKKLQMHAQEATDACKATLVAQRAETSPSCQSLSPFGTNSPHHICPLAPIPHQSSHQSHQSKLPITVPQTGPIRVAKWAPIPVSQDPIKVSHQSS